MGDREMQTSQTEMWQYEEMDGKVGSNPLSGGCREREVQPREPVLERRHRGAAGWAADRGAAAGVERPALSLTSSWSTICGSDRYDRERWIEGRVLRRPSRPHLSEVPQGHNRVDPGRPA